MKQNTFQSVIYKEDQYYVAQCLDIDVSSFGESENEALANLKEALELYLDDQPKPDIHQVNSPKIVSLNLQHA